MRRASGKKIATGIATAGAAAIAGYVLVRPRMRRWGATEAEMASALPGDDRVANADYVTTYAVTILARPADIWPWLAQMGYRRGGLYSYDWLDRAFGYLDAPSANEVLPEFQKLEAGDTIPLGRGPDWPVVVAEPEHALVLEPIAGVVTWAFEIRQVDDGSCRLLTRVRFRRDPGVVGRLTSAAMDPAAFMMTRRMLLGIKRRAEARATSGSESS
jgi:hypothetical protein